MKQPATWQFMVAAVLLMGLGGGVTYCAQWAKLQRDWAALVPDRPAELGDEAGAELAGWEQAVRRGDLRRLAELGQWYLDNGYHEPAEHAFAALLQRHPGPGRWWLSAAQASALTGESRVAKARLRRARERGLSDGVDYWRAGQLAERLGEQVEAKGDYEEAVARDPGMVPAWLRLITLYRAVGDEGAARRTFAAALAANPNSPGLLMDRGSRFRERENWAQAFEDFDRVMTLAPEEGEPRYAAAQALFRLDRREEAEALLTDWLADHPHDPVALLLLCVEALTLGDRAATDRWYARLRSLPEFNPRDRAFLAGLYRQQFGEPLPE